MAHGIYDDADGRATAVAAYDDTAGLFRDAAAAGAAVMFAIM